MLRFLILFLALLPIANAQQSLFRKVHDTATDTHIEATALFSTPSLGGYHPVRIVIANNQKIPHQIFLSFKDETEYRNAIICASSYSFRAPAGQTVTHDILVPLAAQNGNSRYPNLHVNMSGTMGKTSSSTSTTFSSNQPNVLLSEALYTINASSLDTENTSRSSTSYYRGGNTEFASKFDPKQLPDDWRAFSGFDYMLLTEADWAATPPASRNAILSWLRLGGQIIVFSENPPTPTAIGLPEDASYGNVRIEKIASNLRLDPKDTLDLVKDSLAYRTRLTGVTKDYIRSWPLQNAFGEKSFHYAFFIAILVAFGILVGPVNLFVFAKSGRRHRLFITTPLISIITSLLLIGLIIYQDGFGGAGSRVVLMEVRPDQGQNAAFIHQEQFSRTGVMTSPSYTIDASALIVPVPIDSTRWARFTDAYNSHGNYDLQPSDGKLHASGDWFQSRSEQGQLLTAVVPTRGRIEATSTPNQFISTFDFPLATLAYCDENGDWFRADNIAKGTPTQLTPIEPSMIKHFLDESANLLTQRPKNFYNQATSRKGSFVALTHQAPAIPTHPGITWQKTTTIITGVIKP